MPINGTNGIGWKVIGPAAISVLIAVIGWLGIRNLNAIDHITSIQDRRGGDLQRLFEDIKYIHERLDRLERRPNG